jgi:hypothetical protein
LSSALRYNDRLCLLCGFNFLKTPSNGTFTNFRDRLGDDTFYQILHRLIAQAIIGKTIRGLQNSRYCRRANKANPVKSFKMLDFWIVFSLGSGSCQKLFFGLLGLFQLTPQTIQD